MKKYNLSDISELCERLITIITNSLLLGEDGNNLDKKLEILDLCRQMMLTEEELNK